MNVPRAKTAAARTYVDFRENTEIKTNEEYFGVVGAPLVRGR